MFRRQGVLNGFAPATGAWYVNRGRRQVPHFAYKEGDTYTLHIHFNMEFINELKTSVPSSHRKYNPENKTWRVHQKYWDITLNLIETHYSNPIEIIEKETEVTNSGNTEQTFEVLYVGRTKIRPNGESTAMGFVGDKWKLHFPESVLRSWFHDERTSLDTSTYYSTIGITLTTEPEEIKSAYRRLAKQWHPDVCKEPDAQEQFMRLQAAYEILSDPVRRKKYDAGIRMLSNEVQLNTPSDGYRSKLRCGMLTVRGESVMDAFIVHSIIQWEDIVQNGLTMVSSWIMGQDKPLIGWC